MKDLKVIIKVKEAKKYLEGNLSQEYTDTETVETTISFANYPMYMNLYKEWASKLSVRNPGEISTFANFLNGVLFHCIIGEDGKHKKNTANQGMENINLILEELIIKDTNIQDKSTIIDISRKFYDTFDDVYLELEVVIGTEKYFNMKEQFMDKDKNADDINEVETPLNISVIDVAKKSVEKELRFNPETGMMQPVHTKPNGFIKKFFRKEK